MTESGREGDVTVGAYRIVVGQRVEEAKVRRSKELRRRMTEADTVLWQALRAHQLPGFRFRRQQVIDGFIVDFYCHAAGLVVEVDGEIHESRSAYDAERDRVIAACGLHILRISNQDVLSDLPGVLAGIRSYLSATPDQSASPLPEPRSE